MIKSVLIFCASNHMNREKRRKKKKGADLEKHLKIFILSNILSVTSGKLHLNCVWLDIIDFVRNEI